MRILFLLLLLWGGQAWAESRELLLVINFPQRYDYVPNFNDAILQKHLHDWQDKRLILIGSSDKLLSDSDSDILNSSTDLQLRRSEALRLARKRGIWMREKLVSLGLDEGNLHLGVLTESLDDSVVWGGIVSIYAIGE